MLSSADPTSHPSLILVEAFDLSQVSRWGALHLETLLERGGGYFIENRINLSSNLK